MKGSGDYLKQNGSLAWPLAFNALLIQSMLMIDTLLVAPLGELSVAAMGIATTIITFVLGVEIAIGNGIQMLVGKAYGSGKKDDLKVAFWAGLLINSLTALFFFLLLVLASKDLVNLITNDTLLAQATLRYLEVAQYVVLITAYTQTCTAFYNGVGNSRIPLAGFLLEIPLNVALSYSLIHGVAGFAGIGLAGAAWGSLLAIVVRGLFLTVTFRRATFSLRYPAGRPFALELKPQFDVIYPIAANFIILSVGATVYQLLFAQLSVYSFAAITLIFPWLRAGTQFANAWAQASAITISQALGKRHIAAVRDFIPASTRVGMGLSVVVACLFVVLSQCLGLIYPDVAPQTQRALMLIAPLYIVLPIVRAYNTLAGNMLRALGQSSRVLKIHFYTQWVLALPLCAFLIVVLDASVFWAFAIIPLEEIFKLLPFYHYKKHSALHLRNAPLSDL
ncbi:MATE family efflux transporter [Gilvimarinus sp. 2_MG-2023]|uniref:MATE family efflux transporter n=1 Tax=Gilvimarinus sp. 2_MG-2023 TaxID=3062666 RepID=UPI0026E21F04|nr:MATE family efflux transporter [Gilvimarinus sp. 2_MG-2023]MDO6569520.1 MATE family efflux transporter [Gilvimarinus sp. 2_MG-2023]